MNRALLAKRTAIVIVCFLLYRYSKYAYAHALLSKTAWNALSVDMRLTLMLVAAIMLAGLAKWLMTRTLALKDFGLGLTDLPTGIKYAALFIVPQAIGLGFYSNWNFHITTEVVFRDLVLAGFGEEFIFRGFLFGLLFYYAGWGFLSAGILTGLFFGWGHLYQADDIASALSVLLFTLGASLGFSWFYYAWKSLWMVVFLHGFMDLAWDGFAVQTNVTGNAWINLARFATLALAIFYSVRMAKSNNRYDLKKNGKLWMNKGAIGEQNAV